MCIFNTSWTTKKSCNLFWIWEQQIPQYQIRAILPFWLHFLKTNGYVLWRIGRMETVGFFNNNICFEESLLNSDYTQTLTIRHLARYILSIFFDQFNVLSDCIICDLNIFKDNIFITYQMSSKRLQSYEKTYNNLVVCPKFLRNRIIATIEIDEQGSC